jgi:hypothetical protein
MRYDDKVLIARTRAEAFEEAAAWHCVHMNALYNDFGREDEMGGAHNNSADYFALLAAAERDKIRDYAEKLRSVSAARNESAPLTSHPFEALDPINPDTDPEWHEGPL